MADFEILTLDQFAKQIFQLLQSDRDVNLGAGGFTGEGKSSFTTQLDMSFGKASGKEWTFNLMTWSRSELLTWINGKKDSKVKTNGLREGQMPEYTAILCDEFFHMFYRRNWFDHEQIDAISTFNMCRDRHLFVSGNVPDFWDLDSAFTKRIRFYAYVPTRGIAWIFEQENNPFSKDPWNASENKKLFRKHGHPYKCSNFLYEVHFPDWTPEDKLEYYKIRNEKRLLASATRKPEDTFKRIKEQRDTLIKLRMDEIPKTTYNKMASLLHMSQEGVRKARLGIK